jgi:hypothetical protein
MLAPRIEEANLRPLGPLFVRDLAGAQELLRAMAKLREVVTALRPYTTPVEWARQMHHIDNEERQAQALVNRSLFHAV